MNPVTIVTAFFDINRAERGDGRTIDEYKEWIKRTLQLNCNLFIVTEEKFKDFFLENRNPNYATYVKIVKFKDLHYYQYYDQMKEIVESDEYKRQIAHPNRVECVLPEYNIIQYSKFHCLQMAIDRNPFESEFFLWMDAGCSRFFLDVDISRPYPSAKGIDILRLSSDQFIIQKRNDLENFPIDDNFVWRADNLLYGTMFGGNRWAIQSMSDSVEIIFREKMLNRQNVNNEQLALAMVWKQSPFLFSLTNNAPGYHLLLFKYLSLN
jgi:hypothetical protein